MRKALAMASVSASLRALLDFALNGNAELKAALGGDIKVTASSPGHLTTAGAGAQLNIFLFQISPSSSLRNAGVQGGPGQANSRPPLALDLHYLITAYGDQPYAVEMLLGHTMDALHETPVLSRDLMHNVLAHPVAEGTPESLKSFISIHSAHQAEQLKITPLTLSLEELTALWSSLQCSYAPSIAYLVSTVII